MYGLVRVLTGGDEIVEVKYTSVAPLDVFNCDRVHVMNDYTAKDVVVGIVHSEVAPVITSNDGVAHDFPLS